MLMVVLLVLMSLKNYLHVEIIALMDGSVRGQMSDLEAVGRQQRHTHVIIIE